MTYEHDAERFAEWLHREVISDATGAAFTELTVAPRGKFWLGQLAPEAVAAESTLGDRVDRVSPCEMGLRFRTPAPKLGANLILGWTTWHRLKTGGDATQDAEEAESAEQGGVGPQWKKAPRRTVEIAITLPDEDARIDLSPFQTEGDQHLPLELNVEHRADDGHDEIVLTVVNVLPAPARGEDHDLYEVGFEVALDHPPVPYFLETLPSSFRYDRRVPAYGINCGLESLDDRTFRASDAVVQATARPAYWDEDLAGEPPDLRFTTLADDPRGPARHMLSAMRAWRQQAWSQETLETRAADEMWNEELRQSAGEAAKEFDDEVDRVRSGVELLEDDPVLRQAYSLANRAMVYATAGKYEGWRPFQVGFQLATLPALRDEGVERDIVDTLWFATGGGKTETYLGLVLTAAFLDRLRGKRNGVTAWARFPLRMLSLQQTQRFADVLAAAEMVRREERLEGSPFALGFFVGGTSTPNRFGPDPSPEEPDYRAASHSQYRVLIRCPFCRSEELAIRFDTDRWTLDHWCTSDTCPWEGSLPFHVVDDEIFRFLPTVLVGTIDKTAGLGFQASMSGLYGPPPARCSVQDHGFAYATRASRPSGCLVPGCEASTARDLGQPEDTFAPTLRVQDELHLLRDSLGAMSAHYEAALDHLQERFGPRAKVLASSATLAGYERQVEVLYGRSGRVFPRPGPRFDRSFWSVSKPDVVGRQFVGVAPRGVTLDFAADRLVEALQRAIRQAVEDVEPVARAAGVSPEHVPRLVSDFGTGVSYGSTLRDVEAAARSFETQIPIEGQLNAVTLTGRVPFETVREALQRLEDPEERFEDRIHLVAASSMISHGVDVDRLNTMVVMGLPLTTAEFIQATSRVGRTRPGLVFVLHKMLRERDAAVFRSFDLFVTHADRLVEPVPITRRSRAVLERTFPGMLMARLLGVHERSSIEAGRGPLTLVSRWRNAVADGTIEIEAEKVALIELLGADGPLDDLLRQDLDRFVEIVAEGLLDPATEERFPRQLLSRLLDGREPMTSLRDVDVPVPVYSRGKGRNRA